MAERAPLAMVTGGAKRVGRATSLALARAGCDLLVTYNTSEGEARSLAEEVAALGRSCTITSLPLDDPGVVSRLAGKLASEHERLDVLVHNASSYGPSPLAEVTPAFAHAQFNVNALAPLLITKAFRANLDRSSLARGASVVAMVDIHVMGRPRKGFSAYSMSKAALLEMVRTLARELAPSIRVNGVAPGVVEWPDEGDENQEETREAYLRRVPLGRSGTPEDAAECVRWLSMDAHYLTGQIIRVDGGRWLS